MDSSKAKQKETMLTLCVALVLWHLLSKTHSVWMLYASVVLGLIGLFSEALSQKIHWAWMKLAEVMGRVMNKIILSLVFYVVLTPIAFLSRLLGKSGIQMQKRSDTYYTERNHIYRPKDIEKSW